MRGIYERRTETVKIVRPDGAGCKESGMAALPTDGFL
jgi:hypothetical protein